MLLDIHTHTHPGSWDSFLSPDQMVDLAKESGLDGLVLAEHDWAWDGEAARDLAKRHDFMVLPAMELNTEDGHFLVYGMHKYAFGMHRSHELWTHVEELGGVMVAAHPYRRQHPWNWESEKEWTDAIDRAKLNPGYRFISAMEIGNGRGKLEENAFATRLAKMMGFRMTAATDSHAKEDVGKCATYFERDIHNEADLVAELKAGRFWPIDRTAGKILADPLYHSVPDDLHDRWAEMDAVHREYVATNPLHRRD